MRCRENKVTTGYGEHSGDSRPESVRNLDVLLVLLQAGAGPLDKAQEAQIEKDAPQPQVVVALGLLTTKREPSRPSE